MQIIIMSKGRAQSITSHRIFPNAKIVVVESEYDEYGQRLGYKNLVKLPSHLSGFVQTRNFIIDNWADEDFIYIADDDARGIGRNHVVGRFHQDDEDYKTCTITDPDICEALVYRMGECAVSGGCWLFGFHFTKDKHFFGFEPFRVSGLFGGGGLGFVKGHKTRCDQACSLYEDHDIALQNAFQKRFLFIDQRFFLDCVDTAVSQGGLSNERNSERYDKCYKAMRMKWGNSVTRRHANKADNKREMQYNYRIKITIPF